MRRRPRPQPGPLDPGPLPSTGSRPADSGSSARTRRPTASALSGPCRDCRRASSSAITGPLPCCGAVLCCRPASLLCLQQLQSEGQGELRSRGRLDGLGGGGVALVRVVQEVGALACAAADAATEALRHDPLGRAGAHVAAGGVVFQLRLQFLLALLPLSDLVHGDGEALVAVVAGVAGLRCLVDLGLPGRLARALVFRAAGRAAVAGFVQLLGDGEAVGQLDVAVAAQRR